MSGITYSGPLPAIPEIVPTAQEYCDSAAAPAAATTVIKNHPGQFYGVVFNPAISITSSITIYDNASAGSGKIIFAASVTCGATGNTPIVFTPLDPVICKNGITVVTVGAASAGTIYFS